MLYYDYKCSIDLGKGIDVSKSENNKEYIVCHY